MGAGHGHPLHFHGHSPLHRAPAQLKIAGLVVVMLAVVAIPDGWWPAYGVAGLLAVTLVLLSQVPLSYLGPRLLVETPFVVFALLLPLIARGPRVDVLGLSLSRSGIEDGARLLITATIGVVLGLLLAATTEPAALLRGLERLRMPSVLVQIMGFMLRYLEVVGEELRRMRIAATSRGFTARNPRHWPVLAASIGALFIRSFERGERVHHAMLSRGYTGRLP